MRLVVALACVLLPAAAVAQGCPPAPDHAEAMARLVSRAQVAETEVEGQEIAGQMWALWADAPDERAQEMLDRGIRARNLQDLQGALAAFDELVAYCPDYAEGYNQRAFVSFIRGDYGMALEDLDRAIERSPAHAAALAGKGLTLMGLGRMDVAQVFLRQALELNPWLPERRFVTDPPAPATEL